MGLDSSPEHGGGSEGSGSASEDDVCRDYLRSNCRRGKKCKYQHPEGKEGEEADRGNGCIIFCRDYQNSNCRRADCRFVHCRREDEACYRRTGLLPPHVLEAVILAGKTGGLPSTTRPGEAPVCRDYLKGDCRRGPQSCRFRHLTVREYQEELGYGRSTGAVATQVAVGVTQISNVGASMGAVVPIHHHHQQQQHSLPPWQQMSGIEMVNGAGQHVSNASLQDQYMRFDFALPVHQQALPTSMCSGSGICYEPEAKRSRQVMEASAPGSNSNGGAVCHHHHHNTEPTRCILLEEENSLLRKKLEELKKQVSDLTATNEFLLDQNAQLRMSGKHVAPVTVPAVTITSTGGAPTMQVQPITAQIQPALTAGALRNAVAAAATVPVSIAAVAAAAGAPVSIAAVSMAPVQIPAPVVTMAQQQPPPPPPQAPQGAGQPGPPGPPPPPGTGQVPPQPTQPGATPGPPQTLAMSISGATAPLVSYPIMTQDLRPVLQTSLSH